MQPIILHHQSQAHFVPNLIGFRTAGTLAAKNAKELANVSIAKDHEKFIGKNVNPLRRSAGH